MGSFATDGIEYVFQRTHAVIKGREWVFVGTIRVGNGCQMNYYIRVNLREGSSNYVVISNINYMQAHTSFTEQAQSLIDKADIELRAWILSVSTCVVAQTIYLWFSLSNEFMYISWQMFDTQTKNANFIIFVVGDN